MSRDIFAHFADLGMRAEAVIIGTGPNVVHGLPRIPPHAYLLGVNGATTLPIKLHAHLVMDMLGPMMRPSVTKGLGWYPECKIPGVVFIRSSAINDPLADYTFDPSMVEMEATVSGTALDLMRLCRAAIGIPRMVYFCGVDMGGGKYCNGYRTLAPGRWGQCDILDRKIAQCESEGLPVRTLSETEAEVKPA